MGVYLKFFFFFPFSARGWCWCSPCLGSQQADEGGDLITCTLNLHVQAAQVLLQEPFLEGEAPDLELGLCQGCLLLALGLVELVQLCHLGCQGVLQAFHLPLEVLCCLCCSWLLLLLYELMLQLIDCCLCCSAFCLQCFLCVCVCLEMLFKFFLIFYHLVL